MIRGSSKLFHNVQTATAAYMKLEAFKKLAYCDNVKDLAVYTHQLRWIKSPAELELMKESASIACQVLTSLYCMTYYLVTKIFELQNPNEAGMHIW